MSELSGMSMMFSFFITSVICNLLLLSLHIQIARHFIPLSARIDRK
jgi:hypothetical protein